MQGKGKRIIAALVAVAMVTAPVSAWAGEYCATYYQVPSHATGGDYVGGILSYETMGSVTRNEGGSTSTVTTTIDTGPVKTTVTSTTSTTGTNTTTQEPIGIYNMNDGTVWEVNCATGSAHQIS